MNNITKKTTAFITDNESVKDG